MATDKGFTIPSTGTFTFTPDTTNLFLRLPLGALGASTENASFRLTSQDEPAFDKTLTMKDDLVEGDDFAELLFEGVFAGGRFTLEVDPGNGKPKAILFKDKTLAELTSGAAAPATGAGGTSATSAGTSTQPAQSAQSDIRAARQKEQYK